MSHLSHGHSGHGHGGGHGHTGGRGHTRGSDVPVFGILSVGQFLDLGIQPASVVHVTGFTDGMLSIEQARHNAASKLNEYSVLTWGGDYLSAQGFTILVRDFLGAAPGRRVFAFRHMASQDQHAEFKQSWNQLAEQYRGAFHIVVIDVQAEAVRCSIQGECQGGGPAAGLPVGAQRFFLLGRLAVKIPGTTRVIAMGGGGIVGCEMQCGLNTDQAMWTVFALSRGRHEANQTLMDAAVGNPQVELVRTVDPNEEQAFASRLPAASHQAPAWTSQSSRNSRQLSQRSQLDSSHQSSPSSLNEQPISMSSSVRMSVLGTLPQGALDNQKEYSWKWGELLNSLYPKRWSAFMSLQLVAAALEQELPASGRRPVTLKDKNKNKIKYDQCSNALTAIQAASQMPFSQSVQVSHGQSYQSSHGPPDQSSDGHSYQSGHGPSAHQPQARLSSAGRSAHAAPERALASSGSRELAAAQAPAASSTARHSLGSSAPAGSHARAAAPAASPSAQPQARFSRDTGLDDMRSISVAPLVDFRTIIPTKTCEEYIRQDFATIPTMAPVMQFVDLLFTHCIPIAQERMRDGIQCFPELTFDMVLAAVIFTCEVQMLDPTHTATDENEFYRQYNHTLRQRNAIALRAIAGYSHFLWRAVSLMPPHTGTVWRGIRGSEACRLAKSNYGDGMEINWSSWSSASIHREVSHQFATIDGPEGLLIRIEATSCVRNISGLSMLPAEQEHAVFPNSKFVVVRPYHVTADGMGEIHLKEITGAAFDNGV